MAGTSLQQAIFRLVEPTGKAAGVMEDLGIHATDAHGRLLPLDQIVEQLEPRFENTAAMATIFGSRAIKGMGALVAEGSDKLRALTTELEQAGGTAQEVADKKLAGLTGAWTRLQSATEGVFIEIGTRLSPVLERLAVFLTDRVLPAALLARHDFPTSVLEIETPPGAVVGLAEGTVVPVEIPSLGITGERWLVDRITITERTTHLVYRARLLARDHETLYEDYWDRLQRNTVPTELTRQQAPAQTDPIDPAVLGLEGLRLPVLLGGGLRHTPPAHRLAGHPRSDDRAAQWPAPAERVGRVVRDGPARRRRPRRAASLQSDPRHGAGRHGDRQRHER